MNLWRDYANGMASYPNLKSSLSDLPTCLSTILNSHLSTPLILAVRKKNRKSAKSSRRISESGQTIRVKCASSIGTRRLSSFATFQKSSTADSALTIGTWTMQMIFLSLSCNSKFKINWLSSNINTLSKDDFWLINWFSNSMKLRSILPLITRFWMIWEVKFSNKSMRCIKKL